MDLIRLFKSIEELIFEVVSWLYFYPVTLWRIITRPLSMLAYAERELEDKEEEQYTESMSPPIMLVLTLLIVQGIGRVIAPETAEIEGFLDDERNLLMFRALAFGLFPLLFAILSLRGPKSRITRTTLRPAFYSQSYVVVPLVFAISLAGQVILAQPNVTGALISLSTIAVGLTWFLAVETMWLSKRTQRPVWVTLGLSILHLTIGLALLVIVATGVSWVGGQPSW
jgi:hypothetical protein